MLRLKSFWDYLWIGEKDCSLCHGKGLIEKPFLEPLLMRAVYENPPLENLILNPEKKTYISWCIKCFSPGGPRQGFVKATRIMLAFTAMGGWLRDAELEEKLKDEKFKEGFIEGGKFMLERICQTYCSHSPALKEGAMSSWINQEVD